MTREAGAMLLAAEPAAVTWAAGLSAIGAVTTPLVVAALGYGLSRKLKRIEARQWKSQELITARLRYYEEIAGPLNDLMCYFAFIGSWKEMTPPDVVGLKRSLDRRFYTAVPLFTEKSAVAYDRFMGCCFETYGDWGSDARLRTGYGRRRDTSPVPWKTEWNEMFTLSPDEAITESHLLDLRQAYNDVVARLVGDIQLSDARTDYSSAMVVLNAH